MPTLTEGSYLPDWLKYEDDERSYSRAKITVLAGSGSARALTNGMVISKITTGTAVSAAKTGGNTGNGTLTVDATTPVFTGAIPGVYTVRFTVAATNNGTFVIRDPYGVEIGTVVMAGGAGTYTGPIKFAVADGATDFVVGDGFDITVSGLVEKWVQLAPAATDGSQIAAGLLAADVTAPNGTDAAGVAIVRHATYLSGKVTWPAGITNAQKAIAIAQLKALSVLDSIAG